MHKFQLGRYAKMCQYIKKTMCKYFKIKLKFFWSPFASSYLKYYAISVGLGPLYVQLSVKVRYCNCNRNNRLEISTAPNKANFRERAYSRALNPNKIDRQWVNIRRVRQIDSQTVWWMVFGVDVKREVYVWCVQQRKRSRWDSSVLGCLPSYDMRSFL